MEKTELTKLLEDTIANQQKIKTEYKKINSGLKPLFFI